MFKNKKIMTTILDDKKLNFAKTKNLNDLNWDSMAMLGLISIIDEQFNKKINPNDIRKLKTLGDLDAFITKKTK
jgi:acyl carrier protein